MKKLSTTVFAIFALLLSHTITAQSAMSADDVIENYLETIGGKEKLESLKATRANCNAKAQGMELPVVMVSAAPNKQRMDMNFQGKDVTQMSFDGEKAWGVNFMTMEAEEMDAEQTSVMAAQTDFPDPFYNYKEKGYTIELMDEEEIEGAPCNVIKLTRTPIMVGDKEEENVSLFYIDKDNGVIIKQVDYGLVGPMKGQTIETYLSDYEEVDGVYFAFTIVQKMNGAEVFSVNIKEIEINPDLEEGYFSMPE